MAGWAPYAQLACSTIESKKAGTPLGCAIYSHEGALWGYYGSTLTIDKDVIKQMVAVIKLGNGAFGVPIGELPKVLGDDGKQKDGKVLGVNIVDGIFYGKKGNYSLAAGISNKTIVIIVLNNAGSTPQNAGLGIPPVIHRLKQVNY